jgi:tetratricopeptide (TPR) repeat protein
MHGVTLLLLLVPAQGVAPAARADPDILMEAETAFRAGVEAGADPKAVKHFKQAARLYAELESRGIRNADLYRNLGNACFLHGDLGGAILAYRLGLELAPGDAIMQENLELARSQVAYPQPGSFARPPIEHWPPWLPRPGVNVLFIMLIVVYSLTLLLWLRGRITQNDVVLGFSLLAALFAVGLAGLTLFEARGQAERADHRLVVIAQDDTPLRRGDGLDYPISHPTMLNRGTEASLRFDAGNWLQIQLSSGEVGWVPRTSAVVESPRGEEWSKRT